MNTRHFIRSRLGPSLYACQLSARSRHLARPGASTGYPWTPAGAGGEGRFVEIGSQGGGAPPLGQLETKRITQALYKETQAGNLSTKEAGCD